MEQSFNWCHWEHLWLPAYFFPKWQLWKKRTILQVTDELGAALQCWRWVNRLLHPLSGLPFECCCVFLWQWLNRIDLNCCFLGRLSLSCQKSLRCHMKEISQHYECTVQSGAFHSQKCCITVFPLGPNMDAKVRKSSMQQFFCHYPLCSSIESGDALCTQQHAEASNADSI